MNQVEVSWALILHILTKIGQCAKPEPRDWSPKAGNIFHLHSLRMQPGDCFGARGRFAALYL